VVDTRAALALRSGGSSSLTNFPTTRPAGRTGDRGAESEPSDSAKPLARHVAGWLAGRADVEATLARLIAPPSTWKASPIADCVRPGVDFANVTRWAIMRVSPRCRRKVP
jgi:hypothetical protein